VHAHTNSKIRSQIRRIYMTHDIVPPKTLTYTHNMHTYLSSQHEVYGSKGVVTRRLPPMMRTDWVSMKHMHWKHMCASVCKHRWTMKIFNFFVLHACNPQIRGYLYVRTRTYIHIFMCIFDTRASVFGAISAVPWSQFYYFFISWWSECMDTSRSDYIIVDVSYWLGCTDTSSSCSAAIVVLVVKL